MYKYLNNTADIEIIISSPSEIELILDTAASFYDIVTDTTLIHGRKSIKVEISGETLEERLYALLNELIFLFDTKRFIAASAVIEYTDEYSFILKLTGETATLRRHDIKKIIKAVTMHKFNIKRQKNQINLHIVFDV